MGLFENAWATDWTSACKNADDISDGIFLLPLNGVMKYNPYKFHWISVRLLQLKEAHPTISIRTAKLTVIKVACLIPVLLENVNMNSHANL